MDVAALIVALPIILAGAELFTNGVEWVGEGFGLSEGAVGSVLAAIGTALPETILPLVAIIVGHHGVGNDVGIGAILGSPLMLSTLAMCILGFTVIVSGRRDSKLRVTPAVIRQDLGTFLVMFSLAVIAGAVHVRPFHYVLSPVLLVAYALYVRRHFRTPGEKRLETEAASEVKPLYLRRWIGTAMRRKWDPPPPIWGSIAQSIVGISVIVAGARLFVTGVTHLSDKFDVSPLAFALLVAPIATELPETFNSSIIWARRGKDTLALGNITGAMVFGTAFPVSIGLLLTPWRLSGDSMVAALVALAAAATLYLTLVFRGHFKGPLLLGQGVLYAGYVAYVLSRL
ncbi:MAG: sodium:calcium antiporter [Actinomycetota bacterium]